MTSFFSVVQYVPDPVADERVNIGVLVYGDGKVRARWISDWKRGAAQLGRARDADFLRDVASTLGNSTEADIRKPNRAWFDVIQLTESRASLLPPDELLADIADRFLRSKPVSVPKARTHVEAAQDARKRVREAFVARLGKGGSGLVRSNIQTKGANAWHTFDVGIQNGKLIGGVFALSFEVERALDREIKATAFSLEDVWQAHEDVPLAVAALPPRDDTRELFFLAKDLFPKFGAVLCVGEEITDWASKLALAVTTTG